jgi:hypothetical protein
MYNNEFFNTMETNINGDNNVVSQDMDVDINMMNNTGMPMNNSGVQERVINRTFVHEVPQDCFFMIEKIEKYKYKI